MNFTKDDLASFVDLVRVSPLEINNMVLVDKFLSRKAMGKVNSPVSPVFAGVVAHAVAKMKAGLLVSHQERIVDTYHTFDNPQVSMAYLDICAEWRSNKYGISYQDAKKEEIGMAMDYAARYGDPEIMNWLLTGQMA